MNQLESTLGSNDFPLTYVVRPDDETDESEFELNSFLARNILQAPMEGETFEADSCTFHHLIVEATGDTEA